MGSSGMGVAGRATGGRWGMGDSGVGESGQQCEGSGGMGGRWTDGGRTVAVDSVRVGRDQTW